MRYARVPLPLPGHCSFPCLRKFRSEIQLFFFLNDVVLKFLFLLLNVWKLLLLLKLLRKFVAISLFSLSSADSRTVVGAVSAGLGTEGALVLVAPFGCPPPPPPPPEGSDSALGPLPGFLSELLSQNLLSHSVSAHPSSSFHFRISIALSSDPRKYNDGNLYVVYKWQQS